MERWVDGKLAGLSEAGGFEPSVTRGLERLEVRRARRKRSVRMWICAGAGVAAAFVCAMAFPAPRVFAGRCVDACESLFVKKGVVVPMVGAEAPDFVLKDAAGVDFRLSDYRGKVVLLNFWATWCAPCKAEIPWFEEFERRYEGRGFAVIGVSMDESGWTAVRPFLDANGVGYTVGIGDAEVARKYGGVESIPETVTIDREGRVAARHVGIVRKGDYENEIIRILGKK